MVSRDREINLLFDAIDTYYGYDFRGYSHAFLERRIKNFAKNDQQNLSDIIIKIIQDPDYLVEFIQSFSIQVTEMFRDPEVFMYIRDKITPHLKTYPSLNIWHVGCATGEEVYALAIVLQEEDLLDRCTIYATDFSSAALKKAIKGLYSADQLERFLPNYYRSGGQKTIYDYFEKHKNHWKIKENIKKRITFSKHNITKDGSFGEMNLVLCRNVLIYFGDDFKEKSLQTISNSLAYLGYLILGNKELIDRPQYEKVDLKNKIYRKTS